jgi:tetratricopeptide (TPR) repeat protein
MIMKEKFLAFAMILLVSGVAYAQPGWNFPDNEEDSLTTSEKMAYYTDHLKTGDFKESLPPLQWLLHNVPDLNESIYINGAKIFENLAEMAGDPEQKKVYQDSALLMYDLRIQYFNEEAKVLNRKAFAAYGFYKDDQSKYGELYDLYSRTFEVSGQDVWDQNLLAYMDVVRRYRATGGDVSDTRVLQIYEEIVDIIEKKMETGEGQEKTKENVYRLLAATIDIDCGFIRDKLGPELQENPDDLELAKNIFRFGVNGKCMDLPVFLEASHIIFENEPTYGMAKLIADRSFVNKDFETAVEFYEKAQQLTEENLKKSEIYTKMANIRSNQDEKPEARQLIYKAIEADPGNTEAYNTLGNLYFNSYNDCKRGENEVKDRAVFFAAYDMYKKAGNTEGMQQAHEQFPLMETLHAYDIMPGDPVKVGCWINESFTAKRRD